MAFDGSIKIDTELDSTGFIQGSEKLNRYLESLVSSVDRIDKRLQEIAAHCVSSITDTLSKDTPTQSIDTVQQKIDDLGQSDIPTDNFKRMSAEAEKAGQRLEQLLNKQEKLASLGIPETSERWKSLQYDIEQASQEYDRYSAALERMKAAGEAYTPATQSAGFQQVSAAVSELHSMTEETAPSSGRLASVFAALGDRLRSTGSAAISTAGRLAKMPFEAVANGAKKAVSELKKFSRQTVSTNAFANGLVRTLTSLKTILISRIKRMFISGIFSNVQQALQALQQYSAQFKATMDSLKASASQTGGNLAVLLSNIINTFGPFINTLVSMLSRAITYLNMFFALLGGKRTVTVAKAAKGTDNLAKSTENAAKAQKKFNAELYSFDELNRQSAKNDSGGSGAGGGGAAGAGISFEEVPIDLPQGVADWIERLKEAWKKGDWYGVGLVLADGLNAAMDVVDNWINSTFRPLGVLWAGRIATILNGVVDKLNWEKLGKTIADGLNAIADIANTALTKFRFLNLGMGIGRAIKSWFDNIEWDLIGATFANAWNALLHTIEGIVTTPGLWKSIGSGIGKLVKSWFSTIDINSIATALIHVLNGVTDSIRAFLDQNPFEGVAKKIYSAINRVLHEVDWASLGKALSDLFMIMLGVFHEVVENIDWNAVGQAIGNFLGNIDWAGILTQVADIVFTAFTGVLSGLMSTSGGRMFLALVAALKGLQLAFAVTGGLWDAAVKRWILTGVSPLQSIPQMIGGIVPGLKTALSGLVTTLTTGLSNFTVAGSTALTGAAAVFAHAALGVADALLIAYDVKALKEASDTYQQAQQAHNRETETALEQFKTLYETKGPEIAAQWAETVYQIDTAGMSMDEAQSALVQKIDHYWDDVPMNMWTGFKAGWNAYFGAGGQGLLALLSDAFTGAVNGIKALLGIDSPSTVFAEIGMNLVQGLFNGISETWHTITDFFSGAIANLKTSLSEAWNSIRATAETAWDTIKTNVTTAATGLKTAVTERATQLKTNLANSWTNMKTTAGTTWSSIKTTVTTTFNSLKSSVQSSASTLKSNLSTAWNSIKSTASNAWNAIKTKAVSSWTSLASTVSSKWTALKTKLKSVEWSSVGKNLVNGLKNGITGAWGGLLSKVSSLVSGLVSKVKEKFGVHSPSTVFAEIGEYLDAGLEQGIENGKNGLISTAANLASAVTDGMTPNAPQVEMTADGITGSMQAILEGLTGIAATFQSIAAALSAMGGFTSPQIASGTVVPYKTKVGGSGANEGEYGGSDSYLSNIEALLQTLIAAVSNGNGRGGDVKVIIDGREVFQAVVNENNRAIQRTGRSPIRV